MISASRTGTTAAYTYDPTGRRISKDVNGQVTGYIYDGDQVIAEYDGTGALTKKFIYGPGIDEPIKGLSLNGTTTSTASVPSRSSPTPPPT